MFFSFYLRFLLRHWLGGLFSGGLKVAHGLVPELIEVSAEAGDAFRAEPIEAAGTLARVGDETCILEDFEVLGDGGTGDGKLARQLVDGDRAGGEFLEDGHAGLVAEGIESGL
jgi:hypothetical protein